MKVNICVAHPLGYTLSWAFFLSPKTHTALSARQREQGLAPSHLSPSVDVNDRTRPDRLETYLGFFETTAIACFADAFAHVIGMRIWR